MKIGILTHYYNSVNYGGNLQAYALCKLLEELGHQPEQLQIDMADDYRDLLATKKERMTQRIKKLVKPAARLLPRYRKKWQAKKATLQRLQAAFHRFNRELIPHSQQVYTPKNIKSAPALYDVFITGSDQVWNPIWYFPPFFLDFAPASVPKLSYAASIGQTRLPESVQTRYRQHLKDFLAVSVREENGVSLLADIAPVQPQWVLDPTLLLSQESWQQVAEAPALDTPYLFCYFLGNDPAVRRLATDFARAKGLTLVTIPNATGLQNTNDTDFGDIRLADPSPEAFLGLIENAEHIFTDSFHATAFSLIFRRQFFTFPRPKHGSSRITSLLQLFDARDRFRQDTEGSVSELIFLPALDYAAPSGKFTQAREASIAFLQDNLQKAKEMLAL